MQVVKVAKALVEDESAVLEAEESRCSAEAKLLKGSTPSALWAPNRRADTYRAFRAAPRFVLLDFRHAASLVFVSYLMCRGSHLTCLPHALLSGYASNKGKLRCCASDGGRLKDLRVHMTL